MDNTVHWLLIFFYDNRLIRVALGFDPADVTGDCLEYPLEPENQKQLKELLPLHLRSFGKIIEVQEIHGVYNHRDSK